ncbi:preprotein translocase subunit SecG [Lacticigenium naphthae]|uniref:preprotein translocase subunit SecG n=1 Tax=Lacticigenium naphthae TaxID=515351 RepID=UPI0003F6FD8E|nr:preprotein translocase subunit SecG [Lacticigenium naphthae]
MYDLFLTLILIVSILQIIVIAMQPTKTQNASNAFLGGATQLFGKTKVRGFEAFLQKLTIVLGVIFFALAIALAFFV